ncbi:NAD(P)/FAD-dependent oxidoreductase [Jhaorihella thermophila]
MGHGSTAGSCAIIRMHYSTFDGTAFAWEGYHYWRDWAEYLGLPAGANLARFRQTGCLVMKTPANGMLERHMAFSADLGCPFEEWDAARIVERLPIYSLDSFAPARRLDDPDFGKPNGGRIEGAVFWPLAGYVTDPALSAQNLMDAARAHGARVRTGAAVVEILQSGGRAQGVKLAGGEELHAPVVVNVAGPGSSIVNRMAGVTGDMTIETRPLRQEVVHIPAPDGFDFETRGTIVSDSDIACYCRPEQGQPHPCRERGSRMRPAYVGRGRHPFRPQLYRAMDDAGHALWPAGAGPRHPVKNARGGGPLRRLHRLDSDLRQVVSARVLHGLRHQRKPVQERADRRKN